MRIHLRRVTQTNWLPFRTPCRVRTISAADLGRCSRSPPRLQAGTPSLGNRECPMHQAEGRCQVAAGGWARGQARSATDPEGIAASPQAEECWRIPPMCRLTAIQPPATGQTPNGQPSPISNPNSAFSGFTVSGVLSHPGVAERARPYFGMFSASRVFARSFSARTQSSRVRL